MLSALIACLRHLIDTFGGRQRPTLVLNGDILELALADDNVAAMVFDRFIDLAFDPKDPLFQPTILYVPGNHDHHIWETAREHMYAQYVATTARSDHLLPPWHSTQLFVGQATRNPESELLNALVRRRRGHELHVKVFYPNLGLESGDAARRVLVHHGHFTESLYRLMSATRATLFPKQPDGHEVWDWEADNFAWIDFFWSTLGRSGSAGQDVGLVYDMLQDPGAMERLGRELGSFIGNRGFRPTRFLTRRLGREIAGDLVEFVLRRERLQPEVVLTAKGLEGLSEYLSGPVASQYARYATGTADASVSFVFGHTHKPFEARMAVPGFAKPVDVYNTGGWVVDTSSPRETQGASVVLIGDDGSVASLRLYNQRATAADYSVRVGTDPAIANNELTERLAGSLRPDERPWRDFSAEAAKAVELRHRLLPRIIQRGLTFTSS